MKVELQVCTHDCTAHNPLAVCLCCFSFFYIPFLFTTANFYIPKAGDVFQEVSYSDIYGIAAEKIVRQYREDALGLPSYPQSKRGRYDNYRSSGGGGSRYGGHRSSGHSDYSSHSYGYV